MHPPTIRIPAPEAGDPSDVAQALQLAGALWNNGAHAEALRWVKRAVEAADEAGDAARVATLARAVAELGTASAPPPPTPPPPPLSRRPPPLPLSTRPPPPSGTMAKTQPPPPLRQPPPLRPATPRSAPPPGEVRRRVSVKTSVRDPDLLVVRPLADGQAAPPGTREAFLVMADREDAVVADAGRSTAR